MTLAAAAVGRKRRGAGSEERPVLGDYAVTTRCNLPELERSSMAKDTRWDQNLPVAPDACGLAGHAGAVLLRKLADQCGLTPALGAALGRKGKFPLIDRGMALVSMAVAIALGATSMSDIAVLAHQEPVLGAAPSDTTVRRALELADARTLDKIARARAAVRARVWQLICSRPAGFPWLAVAGKLLAGWLVIDLDATLITARSDKDGAASTFKMGYGFHPLGAWCANTAESLAMLLRPGNAGPGYLRRSSRGADRGAPADPGPDAVAAAGPRRRGRRQPRAHQAPAVAVIAAPHCAVHLRLGHHRRR
jgi:Transposase DDE domain group 1